MTLVHKCFLTGHTGFIDQDERKKPFKKQNWPWKNQDAYLQLL